ncbi:hypothetical protein PCANB_002460 [Pneumocystis canis]|nr:hypothetical protein PCK1_002525 [Pneumocystis canis]KAG5438740.1 hypothetical protein PCANB_002460 [Pneumocystis canis]
MDSKKILLALPNKRLKLKEKFENNPMITRLGGLPIGLDSSIKPPVKFSKCKNCQQIMPLILQTPTYTNNINYKRIIYIWACSNKYCQYKEGTIRAIRGVLYKKETNLENSLFNNKIHPKSYISNSFQMNSSQLNIKLEKNELEEWPEDDKISQYSIEFLYIIEEKEQNLEKEFIEKLNIGNFHEKFVKNGEDEWSGEVYEKSTIEKGFRTFIKKISSNPQQCVRYNRQGHPLYYSLRDPLAKKIKLLGSENPLGKCQLCNSKNVFELQVMPNVINILEKDSSLGNMLWGTIILGTCGNDCIPSLNDKGIGYAEEWIGVQWEDMKK